MKLAGRAAIVTGASRGLGEAIAADFVKEGADVLLAARGVDELRAVTERLTSARVSPEQIISSQPTDVSREADVQRLVECAVRKFGRIDVLVCNAGVYGPLGRIEDVGWTDWVHAVEINLFGTVLSCRAVVPVMRSQAAGKIIILSGGGATKPLPHFSAYAASKAGVVRFAETLAEELGGCGVDVNTVAPGSLNTRLLEEVLAAGPDRVGQAFFQSSVRQQTTGGTPLRTPVELITFLASSESDGITGRLIAAVWDNWRELPEQRERLANSDVYTLRRITPEDRGWQPA